MPDMQLWDPGGTLTAVPGLAASLLDPVTEEWLQITGQDVSVDKSCSWGQGEDNTPAVLLRD